mmetsp:Transcript_31776/g.31058  ORF Transcript_31776/g.31058 Transcript_31776/m.31058 type:complete len:115 (+) Transcript_31776:361-705(+)|eukprot:CAMPEP_0170551892 /NCGR_PEP_ID=MMETSP0211-20121228/9884_1 /TAXON_ID=311385 /ORGANISM="Pseudokeronopsis sp., Strain OXSARD2" /LENGTH=114 /DNA_ID=CAMNT_0010859341 /DNA_START=1356 /DNA_END=1700 /DNA_ORIENTATION=+
MIEKKGEKYLVPVRYSVRHKEGNQEAELERLMFDYEKDFEYTPNQNEELFHMDMTTLEIQKLLKSRSKFICKEDISEVLVPDLGNKGNFSLVKVKEESRAKFGGSDQVIASIRK